MQLVQSTPLTVLNECFPNFAGILGTYWKCSYWCLVELELMFRELRPFKRRHFGSFFAIGYYHILLVSEGFFSYFVNVLGTKGSVGNKRKICIWLFNIDANNFDNDGHSNFVILSRSSHLGYRVCVVNCSYSFMVSLFLKDVLEMYSFQQQALHGRIIRVLQTQLSSSILKMSLLNCLSPNRNN